MGYFRTPSFRGAPPEESKELQFLTWAMQSMMDQVAALEDAVSLTNHLFSLQTPRPVDSREDYLEAWGEWEQRSSFLLKSRMLAARDAVMNVWHFQKAMRSANGIANQSPFVSSYLNTDIIKATNKKFAKAFPDCEALRHAIGHSADLWKSRKDYEENAICEEPPWEEAEIYRRMKVDGGFMIQSLKGYTIKLTYMRKIRSMDILTSSHDLDEIMRLFLTAFARDAAEARWLSDRT